MTALAQAMFPLLHKLWTRLDFVSTGAGEIARIEGRDVLPYLNALADMKERA